MIDAEQVYNFVTIMDENHRSYSCNDGFCFFLRLDNVALSKIKENPKLLTDPDTIKGLLFCAGDNIHFIGVYGRKFRVIRQAIREVIAKEKPTSISWYNQDMSKFIYRRTLCRPS